MDLDNEELAATRYMNATPGLILGLENIMDELVKNDGYMARVGNTTIKYQGIIEDTAFGKREVFYVIRKVE